MTLDEPLRRLLAEVDGDYGRKWEAHVIQQMGPDGAALVERAKRLGLIYARGGRLTLTHRGQRLRYRLLGFA